MDYENTYEQEIDLKELLFTLLYRWRPIVLAAVLLGLLLGGYKVVNGLRSQQDETAVEEAREQYDMELAAYNRNVASSEWDIEKLKRALQQLHPGRPRLRRRRQYHFLHRDLTAHFARDNVRKRSFA